MAIGPIRRQLRAGRGLANARLERGRLTVRSGAASHHGLRLKRAAGVAAVLSSVWLLAPTVASAAPPVILAVGQAQHHPTVTWSLPAGMVTRTVEVSDSNAVGSDGAFFSDHVKSSDSVTDAQTTYTGTSALDPGTYYVHVAGNQAGCDTCPSLEWSSIVPLVIPTYVVPVVQGSGQLTGPGGFACSAAAPCPSLDSLPGSVALTAVPAPGWMVRSWSIEGVDSSDTCAVAHSSCTVTLTATHAALVTLSFELALPTILHAGVKTYRCDHRIEVVSPIARPSLDNAHPFSGTMTVSLKLPSGRTLSRRLHNVGGYYSSPDFFRLRAGTYVVTLRFSGDEWRGAKVWTKKVKLGRC